MSNNTTFDFNAYLSEENRSLEDYIETSDKKMIQKQPTQKSINTILSFSRALEVKQSKSIGWMENLNN
ncbi:hypothetical protein [Acidiluteibacter ferrifornacis]|uniref:Uncharacterized protein n=1 Tax=Acidiluteibacter ferrifornacis TaxID=2692424 RepID=A0A6N9NNV8_9FLAO|nr:hypothetical protein [Acidiluteibacter ferrifornacis]NBG66787.1 hypothetical protein [Acidiluteibacter ferrifornacis]